MNQNIEIPQALYDRLAQHTQGFDTPASVIERLLNYYEEDQKNSTATQSSAEPIQAPHHKDSLHYSVQEYGKLVPNFFPPDMRQFKAFLLRSKKAYVLLHYSNGSRKKYEWNIYRFTDKSDVLNNLRSGYLRNWREKGIVRADVAINENDLADL